LSDDATPHLGIPYVAAGQAQKHVTVNAAFDVIDNFLEEGAFDAITAARSAANALTGFEIREEEVTVSGPTTSTAIVIPARSIVLGVSTRTTVAVAGATSYGCGVSGDATKFGGSLGVALNASNIGVLGPTAFYSDTPVLLTADGADFSGGKVRVSIHLITFSASEAV